MSPKNKKIKTEPKPDNKLDPPLVSEKDLKLAKESLETAAENKRARASMTYYLEKEGKVDAYKACSMREKREFLDKYWAQKLKEDQVKKESRSSRIVEHTSHKDRKFRWMGLETMINEMGEHKARNKASIGVCSPAQTLTRVWRVSGMWSTRSTTMEGGRPSSTLTATSWAVRSS